jgi:hypothetical protein
MEQWKQIEEFDYSISTLGNVRNDMRNKPRAPFNNHDYMRVQIFNDGKQHKFYIHRLVAIAFIPNPNNKSDVDHIDGNKSNNNVSNLRWATHSENLINISKSKQNTSGVKGVHFRKDKQKYQATITIFNKRVHIGYFSTIEEAKEARIKCVQENFGEFAHVSEKL